MGVNMQDYAKLYPARYREAEEQKAIATVRLIRKLVRLPVDPVITLGAIVALVEIGQRK